MSAAFERSGAPLAEHDAELVARIRAGDVAAFTEMAEAHFNAAIGVAYGILQPADAAKDIAQRVFAGIWDARATFYSTPTQPLRHYIMVLARNLALKEIRRTKVEHRHREATISEGDAEERIRSTQDIDSLEMQDVVGTLLAKLSDRRRQILELRFLEQLPFADIARIMGISTHAAEVLALRALEELRRIELSD